MANFITPNCIPVLASNEQHRIQATVQVTDVRLLTSTSAVNGVQNRYRLEISDGSHTCVAMLATQLNPLAERGDIRVNSIIRIKESLTSDVRKGDVGKKCNIVILLDVEVVATNAALVGRPEPYVEGGQAVSTHQVSPMGQPDAKRARIEPSAGGPGSYGGPGAYGAPPASFASHGAVVRNTADARIVPLKKLTPFQNRWTIKARVTSKPDMRTFSNARGEGRLFSFDLTDSDGGEIRVTAWKETADRFFPLVEVGKVYQISKGRLQPARKQYNHLKHEYEITLENTSELELCPDDGAIPAISFSFVRIEEVQGKAAGDMVDVIGVVESVDPWTEITRKNTGTSVQKRSVTVRDASNHSVEVTLWGQLATGDVGQQLETLAASRPILAVKGARVGDFNGKTLSTISSSTVLVNPDIPEATEVKLWYTEYGSTQQAAALSGRGGGNDETSAANAGKRRSTLSMIADEGMAQDGSTVWTSVLATVQYVKTDNMFYPACTNTRNGRQCNKKLVEQNGGMFCETCSVVVEPEYRYIASIQISDFTGCRYVTAFQEAGTEVFGMTANEMHAKQEAAEMEAVASSTNWTHRRFRLKVAQDTYMDEARIKVQVQSVHPVNYKYESKVLLDFIGRLERSEPVFVREPGQAAGQGRGSIGQYGGNQRYSGGGGGANDFGYRGAGGGAGNGNGYGGGGVGYGAGDAAAFAFAA